MSSPADSRAATRRIALDGLLVAVALVLSIVERWIPLELLVPVPGIKLGLANVATLFALFRLPLMDTVLLVLVRSLLLGAITGPTSMLFSLTGGLLALLAMRLLRPLHGRVLSLYGISMAGAAAHNTGQVAVASLLLGNAGLLSVYLPLLLLVGIGTGILTGAAAIPVLRRLRAPQPPFPWEP